MGSESSRKSRMLNDRKTCCSCVAVYPMWRVACGGGPKTRCRLKSKGAVMQLGGAMAHVAGGPQAGEKKMKACQVIS